jgi:hypothetical protein
MQLGSQVEKMAGTFFFSSSKYLTRRRDGVKKSAREMLSCCSVQTENAIWESSEKNGCHFFLFFVEVSHATTRWCEEISAEMLSCCSVQTENAIGESSEKNGCHFFLFFVEVSHATTRWCEEISAGNVVVLFGSDGECNWGVK